MRARVAALLALAFVIAKPAGADGASGSDASVAPCTIAGTTQPPKNLEVYAAATGGRPLARLTGSDIALTIVSLPREAASDRARIQAGSGFEIHGFAAVDEIPLITRRPLSVIRNHVWIGPQQPVRLLRATSKWLLVQWQAEAPFRAPLRAWTSCDALALERRPEQGWDPPGDARGYVAEGPSIPLYGQPGSKSIFSLSSAAGSSGILLYSTEQRAEWVRVLRGGDVVIDAWARSTDLRALPPGELMDQLAPAHAHRQPPRLRLDGEPRVVSAARNSVVRDAPRKSGRVVGSIATGARVIVLDVVLGWASVVPADLVFMPGDQPLWVEASELGL